MIFKSRNPISPTVNITIGGVYFDYVRIVQVELELAENQHDLARIVVAGIHPEGITDYINAPVALSWDQEGSGHEFKGYITHIEPEYISKQGLVNGSPFQLSTMYCFGASFDMKAKVNRVWNDSSLEDIVKEIAHEYQYSYSIPIEDFKYPRLIQSEESDWEFLVRIVDDLGYVITIHETHIHIFDRFKALGRQISTHQLETPAQNKSVSPRPGMILSFNGSFGLVTPTVTSNNAAVDTLDNAGVLISKRSPNAYSNMGKKLESRFVDQLSVNITSAEYAEKLINARSRKSFPFVATVELTGTSGIKPGGIVDVQKFNSKFDGLWYVSKVSHTLTVDKFFTELKIIKDSTNDEYFSIPPVTRYGNTPSSVIKDSFWIAETQMEDIYG